MGSPQGRHYAGDPRVGVMCFRELVAPQTEGGMCTSDQLIEQFIGNVVGAVFDPVPGKADGTPDGESDGLLSCNALLVLAELGPEVLLRPDIPRRVLELFLEIPSKSAELVEVALR